MPVDETLSDIEGINVAATRDAGRRMLEDGGFAAAFYGNISDAPSVAELDSRIRLA